MQTILFRAKTAFPRRGLGAATLPPKSGWGGKPPSHLQPLPTQQGNLTSPASQFNSFGRNSPAVASGSGWPNFTGGSPGRTPPWQQGSNSDWHVQQLIPLAAAGVF